ncbi:MAG: DUF1385 domain-containing protein [Chloroflexi bacterium]|nr:DUF1385 domain-containing protein [Chloroflexota bacterium]
MMRGRRFMAVAARAPNDQIVVTSEALPMRVYGGSIQKIPFLRGITLLWDTLGLGMKALMFSADLQMQEDAPRRAEQPQSAYPNLPVVAFETWNATAPDDAHATSGGGAPGAATPAQNDSPLSKPLAWTTVAVSLVFGIGFFFVTPLVIVGVAEQFFGANTIWSNLAEGLIRLAMLVAYVALIGLLPDIKRVYAYHGAEHMTIHAYEHDDPLDPGHVAQYSPAHPRCGTAFLLEVVAISIILFALLGTPDLWLRVLSRIVLVPVVAGIAYELLRLGGKYPNSPFMLAVVAPGMLLQKLTTRYPEPPQMEVAIASMNELLRREADAAPAQPAIA